MRALWTAASGMKAQQLNQDVIAHNISNVNTTAYKGQKAEFKDLLYTYQRNITNDPQIGQPVNIQIGHGVMPVATSRLYQQGSLLSTENPTDIALEGPGFFVIENPNDPGNPDNRYYTRDGNFKFSNEDGTLILVTTEGEKVLTMDDGYIEVPENAREFAVSQEGMVSCTTIDGEILELGQIQTVQFMNPEGLKAAGHNFFVPTDNSGDPIPEENETRQTRTMQFYLENSNVQLVDEMVRMIVAQRSYEANSKSVQTADSMMDTVNQLKR